MDENDTIAARQIDVYNKVADTYGVSSKAVLLDDPQTQYLRFSELTKFMDFNDENKVVLDIGCGNGELYKFINFQGFRGQYIGYDINEKLLNQARSRFPGINVQNKDVMREEIAQHFDYVVLSGLFNLNVGQSKAWIYEFLRKIFSLCNGIMAFNMISTYVTHSNERMFYLDPAEILTFCIQNISKRITLAHHNLPYNYTVTAFKNDSWNSVKEIIT
ncbi:class I SAM-dependent methyltransferase [Propionivibrio sp.]|uniref:class I SAM-dependent methyltransferase n=1 Tax=Propionivibrio sp. TaxID=2212460 RepID=UPI0026372EB3|nr:class I SAM-dependent methyltransferase [Propionivibrio sp.]